MSASYESRPAVWSAFRCRWRCCGSPWWRRVRRPMRLMEFLLWVATKRHRVGTLPRIESCGVVGTESRRNTGVSTLRELSTTNTCFS